MQKLINKRRERGLSQADMAFKLGFEQSQYCRRENGKTKISKKEWSLMAKILETTLEDIYAPQDGIYVINNETTNGNFGNNNNTSNLYSGLVIEIMKKYIVKLEKEIQHLKKEK
ncbi:helix-turn-helix transcriptional regulator [Polaribacter sp. 11A2H]|uniref:helix-turn-helix transcriptional regulator n=1 Tax=Polaribacter sp. 11A2H TaxID=2687290 RepID=UPI00197B467A|nr:helix-turn-helix transcriptional regulator [Polaribacter sp. 11A2H]